MPQLHTHQFPILEAKAEEAQKTLADEQAKVQALTQEQRG